GFRPDRAGAARGRRPVLRLHRQLPAAHVLLRSHRLHAGVRHRARPDRPRPRPPLRQGALGAAILDKLDSLTVDGGRWTVAIGGHTPYGFEVGEHGVKWVMVRPNKADLASADGTDYAWIKPGERATGRGRALTPEAISRLPWESVGGGLRRRSLIVSAGDPRV